MTVGVEEFQSMKGVGQAEARSIGGWTEAGEITIVSLVSRPIFHRLLRINGMRRGLSLFWFGQKRS